MIPLTILFAVIVALLIKQNALRPLGAIAAALLGFTLASSSIAEPISSTLVSVTTALNGVL